MPAPPPPAARYNADRHRPRRLPVVAVVMIAMVLALGCQREPRPPRPQLASPKQVILISIDALRADYLGPWRDGWGRTPNLDRFAAENVVFRDALTSWPDTSASHKSMLYGLYQHAHRTTYRGYPEGEHVTSPVAAMRQAGMNTAAFFSLGYIAREIGLHYGFEEFDSDNIYQLRDDTGNELPELRRRAFAWLSRHAQEPFFLFLHTYQVHAPYMPPGDLLQDVMERHGPFDPLPAGFPPPNTPKESIAWWRQDQTPEKLRLLRAMYEGQVTAVDRWFGELVEELKRLGIYGRAVILFTADHGEALGEAGHIGHSLLGEEQLHVPLIVRLPGVPARTVEDPVSLVDIMPTLFDLLTLEPPYAFEGASLLDAMSGRARLADDRLRVVESHNGTALYLGDWRLVFDPQQPGSERLMRRQDGGLEPSLLPRARLIRDMVRRYGAIVRQAEPVAALFQSDPTDPTRYTDETLQQLRDLGYLE